MAHFYGKVQGSRGVASRMGGKDSGMRAYAASWRGAVLVRLYVDEDGRDCFCIEQTTHRGAGVNETIARGVLGERSTVRNAAE